MDARGPTMRAAKVKTSFEISSEREAYSESWSWFATAKSKWAASLTLIVVFVVAISKLVVFEESNKTRPRGVAPVKGRAYLTPAEFRGIRLAGPGESVLVTGGLGFIGSHVVELLLHRGFDVTILDDESNGHNHNKHATELVPRDITVVQDLPPNPPLDADAEGGDGHIAFTHVVHLAAAISVSESMTDPDKYEKINFGGSHKVLNWIESYSKSGSGIRRVVAASSAAVYGDPDPSLLPLQETAPYGGKSPYADTKYRMEGLMREFVDRQGGEENEQPASIPATSAVALRFFNVYGPRQDPKNPYSGVISLFLEAASNGKDITVLGDGEMTRDFVYVKDVARAIVMALLQEEDGDGDKRDDAEVPASFAVYNVCTGKSITINELASIVIKGTGSPSDIKHLAPREGDILDSRCDPSGAERGMGFVSAVSQKTGLDKTVGWFREELDKQSRG